MFCVQVSLDGDQYVVNGDQYVVSGDHYVVRGDHSVVTKIHLKAWEEAAGMRTCTSVLISTGSEIIRKLSGDNNRLTSHSSPVGRRLALLVMRQE